MTITLASIARAVEALHQGDVVAYPTEAIYGLGCDPHNPDAIERLLQLKQRPIEKGLILVASSIDQLSHWIDDMTLTEQSSVVASWPGPVTWLFPAKKPLPACITGLHDTVALRVTNHPVVRDICDAFGGAIVSTSANIADHPPARTVDECQRYFHGALTHIVEGELGSSDKPSVIKDVITGRVVREG